LSAVSLFTAVATVSGTRASLRGRSCIEASSLSTHGFWLHFS
jgi:hypothetical protein